MARGWELRLNKPIDSLKFAVGKAWSGTLKDLASWMEKDLVQAMVYGGLGIQGIQDTKFYRFVSSPEGLSQLGIEKSQPPKLLDAYKRTFKVITSNKDITLKFGDTAKLKLATPHPAAGTGNLNIQSWLEWVVDDVRVGSGFVPREKLPDQSRKRIRVKTAPGGLMLPRGSFGSSGLWRFPDNLKDYEREWLNNNLSKIQKAIEEQMIVFLSRRLS